MRDGDYVVTGYKVSGIEVYRLLYVHGVLLVLGRFDGSYEFTYLWPGERLVCIIRDGKVLDDSSAA